MLKYQSYVYVNLRSAEVHTFRGQFRNIPEALEYASNKYIVEPNKPSLRGFMVLLNGNGRPVYPVGYHHPRIPSIAMSRNVDITKAQFYYDTVNNKKFIEVV